MYPLLLAAVLGAQLAPLTTSSVTAIAPERPLDVKVLVLNYDPRIPFESNKRLNKAIGWNDAHRLATGYLTDVFECSGGFIRCRIVEWRDLDEFPVKTDGFRYTAQSYLEAWRVTRKFHEPDGFDYDAMVKTQNVAKLIDTGKVDEVWVFGAPYFGTWESAMAGPGAFEINGGVYDKIQTTRPFAIMGFNYERGVAEMIHDLCHRTEATMSRVYGGWKADELTTNWARFAANAKQSGGEAAVGTCHYPPNAEHDYDYDNPRDVMSTADDWLNYPDLKGTKKRVNKWTWGGPDYQRNYLRWWFKHLPHAKGVNPDGRQNNWWKYVFDFNHYDEQGKPRK